MRARGGLVAALAMALLSACGVTQRTASAPSTSPTTTPSPIATAAATPTPAATLGTPPQPLLIVQQQTVVAAVDATGTIHWSFKPSTVVGGDQVTADVAGSHLLVAGPGKVAVVDRDGTVVGTGGFAPEGTAATLHADPSGTRWAWSSYDGADATGGAVWVAGLGEAPHRVEDWTANPYGVEVFQWSDRGIVTALVPQGCGPYLQERSTAILDPATGRSTPLLGGDRHVTDVHDGLVAAVHGTAAYVSGAATFSVERPSSEGIAATAAISPDGAHVSASLVAAGGCGGPPHVRTVVGTVATQTWSLLDGEYAAGWYDDAHLVVSDSADDGGLRVVDLQGKGEAAPLTHGYLVGVMR